MKSCGLVERSSDNNHFVGTRCVRVQQIKLKLTCRLWSWPHKYEFALYFSNNGFSFSTKHLVGPCSATDQTGK